jgi:hypothetical protein
MDDRRKGFVAGEAVVVTLQTPREKCWGVLSKISAAGIALRGLDLNAFDEWTRSVTQDEPFMGLTELFFPMWRVERVTRDEWSGGVPSMTEQFEQRTGRSILDF